MHESDHPQNLSALTHDFCRRAMSGEFGKQMPQHYCAIVDATGFDTLSPYAQYNTCVAAIVEQCPIRLTDGELLAGSATLDKARSHQLPAALSTAEDPKKQLFRSHSHLTPHYHKVIRRGLRGLEAEIAASLEKHSADPEKCHYLQQLQTSLTHMKRWHSRYLSAIDRRIAETDGDIKARWQTVRKNLSRVPMEPAGSFREAIQSLWFLFAFQRLVGNWAAVGRFDWMLGDYLEKDLNAGIITLDEAREYIAHFWIKGCEWVDTITCVGHDDGGGDGQFYQNVVLSGCDAQGNDETNAVTYLVLEVLEELGIADYPTSVRIRSSSPEKLIRQAARVIRRGGGILAVYNDDVVIDALVDFGYSREEACRYANDGCWEVQIPDKTNFLYWAWDVLAEFQRHILHLHDPAPGTDLQGATAALRSYGGLDMRKLPGGTALEIKLGFATVRGEDGLKGLEALLYAFCQLGCHFMQLDVVDAAMLRQAQDDPENYGNLVVRVSGWSSRFRTLEKQWQQLVIQRTEMGY